MSCNFPFRLTLVLTAALIIFSGCREKTETAIKGTQVIWADESYKKIIDAEAEKFSVLYPDAKITVNYTTAREGIIKLLKGEAEIFISSRDFNEEELKPAKQTEDLRRFKFCYDGLAVISADASLAGKISMDEISGYLKSGRDYQNIYIPEPNSGVNEFLKNTFGIKSFSSSVKIVQKESEITEKVLADPGSIGILSLPLIPDSLKEMILETGSRGTNGIHYFRPHPGYLVNQSYPLVRTGYILLNETGPGLAGGFATFLTSAPGQKIVLQADLGPATVPVKLIELR